MLDLKVKASSRSKEIEFLISDRSQEGGLWSGEEAGML